MKLNNIKQKLKSEKVVDPIIAIVFFGLPLLITLVNRHFNEPNPCIPQIAKYEGIQPNEMSWWQSFSDQYQSNLLLMAVIIGIVMIIVPRVYKIFKNNLKR